MSRRCVSIWFRYLTTDWFSLRQPDLRKLPLVLKTSSHGRMVVTSMNFIAENKGIHSGMVVADAMSVVHGLKVLDEVPDLPQRLLKKLGQWSIQFSPVVAMDLPDGLFLDATGCTHLWGGDEAYVKHLESKFSARGYYVRIAMADTYGAAWAIARYGKGKMVVPPGEHLQALLQLPPECMRVDKEVSERLHKLGLHFLYQIMNLPRTSLRRRFGPAFIRQLNLLLGFENEPVEAIQEARAFEERIVSMEPIVNAKGIEIAMQTLLHALTLRLQRENLGVRKARLICYKIDNDEISVEIVTNKPSYHAEHLFRLFHLKVPMINPGSGIEVFIMQALVIEDHFPIQQSMWTQVSNLADEKVSELVDRLSNKIGRDNIFRFLPAEHHWPERSVNRTTSLEEQGHAEWPSKIRPFRLLEEPEAIEVSAPIPDYPPMLFRYKGKVHKIIKADGPERIEQEWWIQLGQHRDYYAVEDEEGSRYWLFRAGYYDERKVSWFLHGYFA